MIVINIRIERGGEPSKPSPIYTTVEERCVVTIIKKGKP